MKKRELIGTAGPFWGVRFRLDREIVHIGRDSGSHIFLDDETVSRRHGQIALVRDRSVVSDVGSRNGVFVSEGRIKEASLKSGDPVRFGRCAFVYWEHEAGSPTLESVGYERETAPMEEGAVSGPLPDRDARGVIAGILMGASVAIEKVRSEILAMGPTPLSILFLGETGTGKELASEAAHKVSEYRNGPLIQMNCAALPESLLESELFGHEKGAFTGAETLRKGKFELAHEGSLLLDEIGDMSPSTQSKILRVLQDRTFFRVGGSLPLCVRTRVLAATLKDLDVEMREGRFRPDLLYRLNAVSIRMPSLSERREDIPILVDHFRSLWIRDTGKTAPSFHDAALGALHRASWPGNVRQLKNVVDRLSASIRGEVGEEDVSRLVSGAGPAEMGGGQRLSEAREDFERRFISDVLAKEQGNVSRTAEVLGVDRHNLAKKLKKLGVRKGTTHD